MLKKSQRDFSNKEKIMGKVFFFDWEISFMVFLQSFESKFVTAVATFFTMLGEEYVLILLLGLLYWSIDKKKGKKIALIAFGSSLFGSMLKGLAVRRRPYMDNSEIKCIRAAHPGEDIMVPYLQGFSMPSLHSSMSASLCWSIERYFRKTWSIILAIVMPLCIGLSRPYLGVHYPTDVLCGWAFGIISVFVFGAIADKHDYKLGFLALIVAGFAGCFFCRDDEFFTLFGVLIGMFLGFMYEEKYVGFEKSKKWWSFIARPVLGLVIFAALNALLKIPVKNINSDSHRLFMILYRLFRYTVVNFCIIGPYTKLFKYI